MPDLGDALSAFYAGDSDRLNAFLSAEPSLVRERVTSRVGHYCGYFFEATLLHHVAGNPSIRPLPPATPALAALILDHGADVDAATHAGPSQPTDIGWSTLGLVATSLDARTAGHQRPLLELLIARGADVNFRNGGPVIGALYYGEHDAARFLVERGARVDVIAAAGLGRVDLLEAFFTPGGTLRDAAHTLVHYGQSARRPESPAEILGVALVYACLGGHQQAVEWLLARSAPATARIAFDHDATALHWAALHGHREICGILLRHGADRRVLDATYAATPAGWAEHNGHAALAQFLTV